MEISKPTSISRYSPFGEFMMLLQQLDSITKIKTYSHDKQRYVMPNLVRNFENYFLKQITFL